MVVKQREVSPGRCGIRNDPTVLHESNLPRSASIKTQHVWLPKMITTKLPIRWRTRVMIPEIELFRIPTVKVQISFKLNHKSAGFSDTVQQKSGHFKINVISPGVINHRKCLENVPNLKGIPAYTPFQKNTSQAALKNKYE